MSEIENKLHVEESIHYIKYMGSKTKILPFVIEGIEKVYQGGHICDLFAGSCSLAGALGKQAPIISNDIQEYSSVIARSYLTDWYDQGTGLTVDTIIEKASKYHQKEYASLIDEYKYSNDLNLKEFNELEKKNRALINREFRNDWHLFTKYYSGTWWSAEQCSWIDSFRKVIEDHRDDPAYNTMLSSLMFAMAYNSQGTGHYAQYRDAKTKSSMKDIKIYRSKDITSYFRRKLKESLSKLPKTPPEFDHQIYSKDYMECLEDIKDSTVYADPPYCFVHYSRFYHALETIVLYDYPEIQIKGGKMVKGRYREGRHQSPFCIRTQVEDAFDQLLMKITENNCSLVLSYSDTGMISLERILKLAEKRKNNHEISVYTQDHTHMTMGRRKDRERSVQELLVLIKPK